MLREIIQCTDLIADVIARSRQPRYVDVRELLLIRDHLLPEQIVARMVEPTVKEFIGPAICAIELAVRIPALVPALLERAPSGVVVRSVPALFVGNVVHPPIRGVSKDVVSHGGSWGLPCCPPPT